MRKKYNTIILISFLLLAVFFTACGNDENVKINTPIKVKVKKIIKVEVPFQYEYPGNVEGVRKAKLSTKLMGTLIYFPFEAGTKITKGQILAKIKSAGLDAKRGQVNANILQAKAAFNNIKINYKRIKRLYALESASKKELEDTELAYKMAKERLKAAEEMKKEISDVLSYSIIKAPFNGYIVNKFFEQGDITSPGRPIMTVESFNKFKVNAQVSADEINLFTRGGEVKVYIDAVSPEPFIGKVKEINPGGNSYSKQFGVQILLNKKGVAKSKIMSGMYARVVLENKTKPIIAINKNYLVKRGQLEGVYTVSTRNEALLRWVRLGKTIGNKVEILSGLSAGEVVITDKNKVKDGQKIEVVK